MVNELPVIYREQFEIEGPILTFNSRLFQVFENSQNEHKKKTELKYKFGFSTSANEMCMILKYDLECLKNWVIQDGKIVFTYTVDGLPDDENVINRLYEKAKNDLSQFFESFNTYLGMVKKFNAEIDKYVDMAFDEILVDMINEKNKKERLREKLNPFV